MALRTFLSVFVFISTFSSFGQVRKLDIYFASDEYRLTDSSKKKLDEYRARIQGDTINNGGWAFKHLEITGYTDTTGPENYNKELAMKRLLEVKEYLFKKGEKDSLYWFDYSKEDYNQMTVCNFPVTLFRIRYEKSAVPLITNNYGETVDFKNKTNEPCRRVSVQLGHSGNPCGGSFWVCYLPKADTTIDFKEWGILKIPVASIQNRRGRYSLTSEEYCDSVFSTSLLAEKIDSTNEVCSGFTSETFRLKLNLAPSNLELHGPVCNRDSSMTESCKGIPGNIYLKFSYQEDSLVIYRKPNIWSCNKIDTVRSYSNDRRSSIEIPADWLISDSVCIKKIVRIEKEIREYLVSVRAKKRGVVFNDLCRTGTELFFIRSAGLFRRKKVYKISSFDGPQNIQLEDKSGNSRKLGELSLKKGIYIYR